MNLGVRCGVLRHDVWNKLANVSMMPTATIIRATNFLQHRRRQSSSHVFSLLDISAREVQYMRSLFLRT
jgi:hypothetical protein